ncbi:MAG: CopG family transcriptional regulator [Candidatus Hodarchaeota archaeon]
MYKEPNMEKLTINLPPVEIARIDILIEAGYYPSRAEFIRTAIRRTLDFHQDYINKKIETITLTSEEELIDSETSSRYYGVGLVHLNKNDFEKAITQGKKLKIRVVGVLDLKKDVTPEHIKGAVESIKVYGILKASSDVKAALRSKQAIEE